MSDIQRLGTSPRWADVVIHNNTAYWVEVADDASAEPQSAWASGSRAAVTGAGSRFRQVR